MYKKIWLVGLTNLIRNDERYAWHAYVSIIAVNEDAAMYKARRSGWVPISAELINAPIPPYQITPQGLRIEGFDGFHEYGFDDDEEV